MIHHGETLRAHPPTGPLLEVTGLSTAFKTERGLARAVQDVSFSLEQGKTLGIVGESGSGKTVLSRTIMGLITSTNVVQSGSVRFEGREVLDQKTMQDVWGTSMAMIFQDAMTSLNPVMRVGKQITESLRHHLDMGRTEADETAVALLRSVGIPGPEKRLRVYPHELSGGMRQRVMIAIALACGPKLLFADEPTTALDVTVQAQILDLLQEQQAERFMAVILVTHDLGVVAGRTDDIAVMYAGRIVERAPTPVLFSEMRHPYTEALLSAVPKPNPLLRQHKDRIILHGDVADPSNPPDGCYFHPRCQYAEERCSTDKPELRTVADGHQVACHFAEELDLRGVTAYDNLPPTTYRTIAHR